MSVRILTTPELSDLPEPTYLLEPFLADRGLTVLFGASGTLKLRRDRLGDESRRRRERRLHRR